MDNKWWEVVLVIIFALFLVLVGNAILTHEEKPIGSDFFPSNYEIAL